jgi:glycosyltransferase involved in cell wall biosynthesis
LNRPTSMPESPSIILLSNVRWDALWEYSHALATLFANAGYPTVFVETTGMRNPPLGKTTGRRVLKRLLKARSGGKKPASLSPNLTVYSPLVVPPTYGMFRRINRRLFVPRIVRDLRRLIGTAPVVIAFAPTRTTLDLVSGLRPRLTWYHCTLNYEEIPDTPADIKHTERQFLATADTATVDSGFLKEKHRRVRPDMIRIEGGVDFELFRRADTGPLESLAKVLYYFGRAYERVFDFELVRAVAEAGFTVRMLGTLSEPSFARTPGVEFLGEVPHEALPEHLREADALIIPYKITPFTQGTFPAKTYECLATGKPVLATPLPDLKPLDEHVYLGDEAKEFVNILRCLHENETPEKRRTRIELARRNSWEARFAQFEELLWAKLGGSGPIVAPTKS